jgi:hypothetical protein
MCKPITSGGTKKPLLTLAISANILPAALLFWFVCHFGVDVPFWDEWAFVVMLHKRDLGTLELHDLLAQHNEHRILFSRLLTLANASLFHWNRKVEMYITAALLVLIAWLVFRLVRTYWSHPMAPLWFLPVTWTLLGWRHWENVLVGFQTQFGLFVAGAVLAFGWLHRTRGADRFVASAAAAGFVSSFSSGGGILIWPVGLGQLLIQFRYCGRDDKPRAGAFIVWLGSAAATCALYFSGYRTQAVPWPTGLSYLFHHPIRAVEYLVIMAGSPLSYHMPAARSLGLLVSALGLWSLLRLWRTPKELVAATPFLAFAALAALTAAAACDQRMGLAFRTALWGRYCSVTALAVVAVYAVLVRRSLKERSPVTLLACGAMVGLLTFGAATNYLGWKDDPEVIPRLNQMRLEAYALRNASVVSDEAIGSLNPDNITVRELAPFLRAHGYSLFHHSVSGTAPARYDGDTRFCNIESVNGQAGPVVTVDHHDTSGVRVEGWAVDHSASEPSQVFVSIDRSIDFPALVGNPRPDVADVLHNPDYQNSGFAAYIRSSLIPDGEHTLGLKIVDHDSSGYWTCGEMRVRVTE